jgi:hypothetical protein
MLNRLTNALQIQLHIIDGDEGIATVAHPVGEGIDVRLKRFLLRSGFWDRKGEV